MYLYPLDELCYLCTVVVPAGRSTCETSAMCDLSVYFVSISTRVCVSQPRFPGSQRAEFQRHVAIAPRQCLLVGASHSGRPHIGLDYMAHHVVIFLQGFVCRLARVGIIFLFPCDTGWDPLIGRTDGLLNVPPILRQTT